MSDDYLPLNSVEFEPVDHVEKILDEMFKEDQKILDNAATAAEFLDGLQTVPTEIHPQASQCLLRSSSDPMLRGPEFEGSTDFQLTSVNPKTITEPVYLGFHNGHYIFASHTSPCHWLPKQLACQLVCQMGQNCVVKGCLNWHLNNCPSWGNCADTYCLNKHPARCMFGAVCINQYCLGNHSGVNHLQ